MSFIHCQELGQLTDLASEWLQCSLLCSQSGASLLADKTFDIEHDSKISIPGGDLVPGVAVGAQPDADEVHLPLAPRHLQLLLLPRPALLVLPLFNL